MGTPRHSTTLASVLVGMFGMSLSASPAAGHVILDKPNGGESLGAGSVFTIEWHIQIPHTLLNWDLWYSTTGVDGPWIIIAMNLPPGDPAGGSIHTYDWTVPDDLSDQVRVRVRMDNNGMDYEDISTGNLTIGPGPVPTVSDWGLLFMALLIATAGSVVLRRRCVARSSD